jgi:hypothetical protein
MVWLLYRRSTARGAVSAVLDKGMSIRGLLVRWYDNKDNTTPLVRNASAARKMQFQPKCRRKSTFQDFTNKRHFAAGTSRIGKSS